MLIAPVEEEVRRLLGRHVFAVDDQTMEGAVGGLLRERDATIAVYEDTTAGLVADRLQQASLEHFLEGIIGNSAASMRRLLGHSRRPGDVEGLLADPVVLTDELALAVRAYGEADLGLAVHGVPDPGDTAANLAGGNTFIAITDGAGSRTRGYNTAGRGRPDRTRMSLNAVGLVRLALLEGME